MATTVKELKEWLGSLMRETDIVAIDEGGLCLVTYEPDAGLEERRNAADDPGTCSTYFEVGGVPRDATNEWECLRCKGRWETDGEPGECPNCGYEECLDITEAS